MENLNVTLLQSYNVTNCRQKPYSGMNSKRKLIPAIIPKN